MGRGVTNALSHQVTKFKSDWREVFSIETNWQADTHIQAMKRLSDHLVAWAD